MAGRDKRSLTAVFAASAAVAAMAVPAVAAADTNFYPAGEGTFTGGAQGWVGSGEDCGPVSGSGTCSTTTEYSAEEGNPAGSINARINVLVNAGGLFKGESIWTSPDFQLPAASPTRGAALALDRRLDGPAGTLGPESKYEVKLVDRSNSNSTSTLLTETIDETDDSFGRSAAPVPAGALVAGHTYALAIETTLSTTVARVGLLGSLNSRYDNVNLSVEDSQIPVGLSPIGDGALGSGGVTVHRSSLSNSSIASLLRSINVNAEVGKGPGGSVVPLAKCTIVGTPKKDRIIGTKGNDVICGLGGNDRIDGRKGNDVIDTVNGSDLAQGSTGNDALIGVRGKDRLSGQGGKDRMGAGASVDRLNGGAGNDRLNGGSGNDRLAGGSGGDRLNGARAAIWCPADPGAIASALVTAGGTGSTAARAATRPQWTAGAAAARPRRAGAPTGCAGSNASAEQPDRIAPGPPRPGATSAALGSAADRARRGISGALHSQSALARPNPRPREPAFGVSTPH